mgnify:CR=1 FL=1
MQIRLFTPGDAPAIVALWRDCVRAGDVVYREPDEAYFRQKFLEDPNWEPALCPVAEEGGRLIGCLLAAGQKRPKTEAEAARAYVVLMLVDAAHRGRGVGRAMLAALEEELRARGKTELLINSLSPIQLDWTIPGTPGHDHNNAPGLDAECGGYGFFEKMGFENRHEEVAMYLNLKDYRYDEGIEGLRQKLRDEGIVVGRYDVSLRANFDRMCDRVGSEYWRDVLRAETAKEHPRVILAAVDQGRYMVGFTGPVDLQPSGRGWFTGICTDPEYERRGIATVLFNDLMREFVLEGAAFSTLFTGVDNHARRLYERTGFRAARRFAIMRKSL